MRTCITASNSQIPDSLLDDQNQDGQPLSLRQLLMNTESSGLVDATLAGHEFHRPPSVAQGTKDTDRLRGSEHCRALQPCGFFCPWQRRVRVTV